MGNDYNILYEFPPYYFLAERLNDNGERIGYFLAEDAGKYPTPEGENPRPGYKILWQIYTSDGSSPETLPEIDPT